MVRIVHKDMVSLANPLVRSDSNSITEDPVRPKARPRRDFDPYLGVVCADTWWDLGKLLARRDDKAWIAKQIPAWTKEIDDPAYRRYVTVEAVQGFANRIYDLLRRKYKGESIIDEARLIAAQAARGAYRDNGRYLEYDEDPDVYWATDTRFVLNDLEKSIDESEIGWLNAVEECRECGTFFVKQRRDQIFDTAKCRTKFTNRDSYLRRRRSGGRRH